MEKDLFGKKWFNVLSIAFLLISFWSFALTMYFFHFEIADRPSIDHVSNTIFLIAVIVLSLIYFGFYLFNLFYVKHLKTHKVMRLLNDSATYSFFIGAIINLLSSAEELLFDATNISLFISSSLTLLGFGLAVVAIIYSSALSRIKTTIEKEESDNHIFVILILFIFCFALGLIFSISALLNIQISETAFYRSIIFKALFYSSAQAFVIVVGILIHSYKIITKDSQQPK